MWLLLIFAFSPQTWTSWDSFCVQGQDAVAETEIAPATYEAGLHLVDLGIPGWHRGEAIPTAAAAQRACQNYDAYRAWRVSQSN